MKGKLLSVLFCLMLVFGMIMAACDNGAYPKDPNKDKDGKTTLDFSGSPDDVFPAGGDDSGDGE